MRPSATSCITAVAVTVFEVDPIWKSVSGVTRSGCSTLVTPTAPTYIARSRSAPTAEPGTEGGALSACPKAADRRFNPHIRCLGSVLR